MGVIGHTTGHIRQAGSVLGPDPEFAVVLFNDETHSWAYVIRLLKDVFGTASEDGFHLASQIDRFGRGIAFVGPREACDRRRWQVLQYGPDTTMPGSDGPLRVTVQDAETARAHVDRLKPRQEVVVPERLCAAPDFLAHCETWAADRRCPTALVEWLREDHAGIGEEARGRAMEAAEWAVRMGPRGAGVDLEARGVSGPEYVLPLAVMGPDKEVHCWGIIPDDVTETHFWQIPAGPETGFKVLLTVPAAVAYLLCNFDRRLAARHFPQAAEPVPALPVVMPLAAGAGESGGC